MTTAVLADYRRLVVKIGSSLLIDANLRIDTQWLAALAADVAALRSRGHQVLIVSSGAVAVGSAVLGINPRRSRLEELQAAAAAGQVQLVRAYQDVLAAHDIKAAQVLMTPDDTEVRRRFLNARGTLEKLIELGVVPIINENDTVATDELRYGDNDRLAARVAQTVMADCLVLLSDVDGFYTADPRSNADAEFVAVLDQVGNEQLRMAGGSGTAVGTGGMLTKLKAAQIATHAGCATIIASGVSDGALGELEGGGRHTLIPAPASPAAARKQWLAGMLAVEGELRLDAGAANALQSGNSLLPVGLTAVVGRFRRGDAVMLVGPDGAEIGRGLAAYSSDEATAISGCRSEQIESVLGYRGRSVMVHRDDMVLFDRS